MSDPLREALRRKTLVNRRNTGKNHGRRRYHTLCRGWHIVCDTLASMRIRATIGALGLVLLALSDARDADACGGCFIPPAEQTVVTDHRMAFAISKQQTVLWDQIKYSGDPRDFAWVLPIRPGTTIEASNDEWFKALDSATQPVVIPPSTYGGSFGCGLTGCGADSTSAAEGSGANGGVTVIAEKVVGPYESVTLRASDPDALTKWLRTHDYTIPDSIQPTIDAYTKEKFDFIALRLRPDCGERSMRPVRVVTQGADPTLPLRMVAAGTGPKVGITLYVIAEGRYRPSAPFREVELDFDRLVWDRFANKSNYDQLSLEAMTTGDGHNWIVEYAGKPQISQYGGGTSSGSFTPGRNGGPYGTGAYTPGLWNAYIGACRNPGLGSSSGFSSSSSSSSSGGAQNQTPCPDRPTLDAGKDSGNQNQDRDAALPDGGDVDAGDVDAGDVDAGDVDAGDVDAGAPTDGGASDGGKKDGGSGFDAGSSSGGSSSGSSGSSGTTTPDCSRLDDLDVALRGMSTNDVWLTRLRAQLPADALKIGDLRLEAHPSQVAVSNEHQAFHYADETKPAERDGSCVSAPKRHEAFGSWALAALGALGLTAFVRRRRR